MTAALTAFLYEGTNEINRLLSVDMILKKSQERQIRFDGAAMAVSKEPMSIPDFGSEDDSAFAKESKAIVNNEESYFNGGWCSRAKINDEDEQEIIMNIAGYGLETFCCRKCFTAGDENGRQTRRSGTNRPILMHCYLNDAVDTGKQSKGKNHLAIFCRWR